MRVASLMRSLGGASGKLWAQASPERRRDPGHRIPDALLPNLFLPRAGESGAIGFHEVDRKGVMCTASEVLSPKFKDTCELLSPTRDGQQGFLAGRNGKGKEWLRPAKMPVESLPLSGEHLVAVALYVTHTINVITSMHIVARVVSRNQEVDARRCTPKAAQQARASRSLHRHGI